MTHYHPRPGEHGQPVELKAPSQPTPLSSWTDPNQIATITPDGLMPKSLNGIAFERWLNAPTTVAGWEMLAAFSPMNFSEPCLKKALGKVPASGIVVIEDDGRVWVVSPSNAYGGYVNTFPKGGLDQGLGLHANSMKEGYEETGLQVVLTGYLCDSYRSTSVTRYYLARRVGGHPASMGWESQAVSLVPCAQLAKFVRHKNDEVILQALQALG